MGEPGKWGASISAEGKVRRKGLTYGKVMGTCNLGERGIRYPKKNDALSTQKTSEDRGPKKKKTD